MQVILGPMEGVLDHLMRELLTEINDYDYCITEFIRVVDQLLPPHVFQKISPELHTDSKTKSGTPVRLQLLGQDPNWMAENAARAIDLGSDGIDLNFGCPAKAVNKNHGGATLLKNPELIYHIVKNCRKAVPDNKKLTAKIRLGWEDPEESFAISQAIEQAGANELTIHARTKKDGYNSEKIKWDYINQIRQIISIPIIANGEIWNHRDSQQCIKVTGINSLMVCRGAFNTPNLGNVIKYNHEKMSWDNVLELLLGYSKKKINNDKGHYYPNRVKQWLNYLRQEYKEANAVFLAIRQHKAAAPIIELLKRELDNVDKTN